MCSVCGVWLPKFGDPTSTLSSWHETVCRIHPRTMIAEPAHFYLFGLICLCSGNPTSSFFTLHPSSTPLLHFAKQTPNSIFGDLSLLRPEVLDPCRSLGEEVPSFHFGSSFPLPPLHPPRPPKPHCRPLGFFPSSGHAQITIGKRRSERKGGRKQRLAVSLGPGDEPKRVSSIRSFLWGGRCAPQNLWPRDPPGFLNLVLQFAPPLPCTTGY